MIKNKEELPFPSQTDLYALVQAIDSKLLTELLSKQGVYLLCNKSDKAEFLRRFAFGQQWYAEAFHASDRTARGIAISITGARAEASSLSEVETAGRTMLDKIAVPANKYQPKITKIYYGDPPEKDSKDPQSIIFQIEYRVLKPAYTLMYSTETHIINVAVVRLDDSVIEFRHNPHNSTDALVARDVIQATLLQMKKSQISIDITTLPLESRIDLIDTILTQKSGWVIRGVTEFTVKKDQDDYSQETEGEGDDQPVSARKLPDKDTKLLSRAVLQGENLREHELVKKFLEEGYYFSAVEFFAVKQNEVGMEGIVRVEISFKHTPRLLEVSVGRTRVEIGSNGFEDIATSDSIAQKVGDFYWSEVYRLFQKIKTKIAKTSKKVTRASSQSSVGITPGSRSASDAEEDEVTEQTGETSVLALPNAPLATANTATEPSVVVVDPSSAAKPTTDGSTAAAGPGS